MRQKMPYAHLLYHLQCANTNAYTIHCQNSLPELTVDALEKIFLQI